MSYFSLFILERLYICKTKRSYPQTASLHSFFKIQFLLSPVPYGHTDALPHHHRRIICQIQKILRYLMPCHNDLQSARLMFQKTSDLLFT